MPQSETYTYSPEADFEEIWTRIAHTAALIHYRSTHVHSLRLWFQYQS